MGKSKAKASLERENQELRAKLHEAEQALVAVQNGSIDTLVASGSQGARLFSLQDTEHPYRLIVESMNEGATTLLPDGTILYANKRFEEMLELTQKDIVYSSLYGFVAEGDRVKVSEILTQGCSEGVKGEVTLISQNGTTLPAQLSVNAMPLGTQTVLSMVITGLAEIKSQEKQRRQAEEALWEHKHFLRMLFDSNPSLMFVKDARGRILLANKSFAEFYGMPISKLIGLSQETIHAAVGMDLHELRPGLSEEQKALEEGIPQFSTERYTQRNRDSLWFSTSRLPVTMADGAKYVMTIAENITKRKRAEQEREQLLYQLELERLHAESLAEEAERRAREAEEGKRVLDALMEYIPEGITIADAPAVKIRRMSRYGIEMIGRPRKDLEGIFMKDHAKNWRIFSSDGVTPADPKALPLSRAVRKGEIVTNEEVVIERPDGTKFPCLCNAGPICDERGTITGGIIAWRDISIIKAAQSALLRAHKDLEKRVRERTSALAQASELLGEVFNNLHVLIAYMDTDFNFIRVNRKYAEADEKNPEYFIGKNHFELYPNKENEEVFRKVVETGEPYFVYKRPFSYERSLDRGTTYWDWSLQPVKNTAGRVTGLVLSLINVTGKVRLETIAEAVNSMNNLGYVFSGIRHEIGNPINSIKMTLSVLRNNVNRYSKEQIQEYIDRSMAEIVRMEYLLKSLKNFNMYETMEIRPVSVVPFIDKFIAFAKDDIEKRGITVETDIADDVTAVSADSRALQQVLLNIFANAFDGLRESTHPKIKVVLRKEGGIVKLQVQDNGCGIPEEQQAHLFKPFYTTKAAGTGLGLVIARKMLAKMGGAIEITSTRDKGTRVMISLPEERVMEGCHT